MVQIPMQMNSVVKLQMDIIGDKMTDKKPTTLKELQGKIDDFIKKWCGENTAHLLDNDENDGQSLRDYAQQSALNRIAEIEKENKQLSCLHVFVHYGERRPKGIEKCNKCELQYPSSKGLLLSDSQQRHKYWANKERIAELKKFTGLN